MSKPELLPIVAAVGVTAAGKSAVAISLAQSLSTPLSFFEFQQQHSAETAASPVDAEQGQIVAASVTVDDISAAPQAEFVVVRCASGSSAKVALVDRGANLFVANDCLIAISAIAQGQPLSLNRNCLVAALFKALPAEEQAPLLRYTKDFAAASDFFSQMRHSIKRGIIIVQRVLIAVSSCGQYVTDANNTTNNRFVFWNPPKQGDANDDHDGTVPLSRRQHQVPNACLVPIDAFLSKDEQQHQQRYFSLVALCEIPLSGNSLGELVLVRPLDFCPFQSVQSLLSVSAHIVNVDVMQTIPGLPIGTNKSTAPREQGHIPHYCLGAASTSVSEMMKSLPPVSGGIVSTAASSSASAAVSHSSSSSGIRAFVDSVVKLVADIRRRDAVQHQRSSLILLCGGTLYYQLALLVEGVSMLEEEEVGEDDDDKQSSEPLDQRTKSSDDGTHGDRDDDDHDTGSVVLSPWDKLNRLAPGVAQQFHPNDTRRILRQIEIASQQKKKTTMRATAETSEEDINAASCSFSLAASGGMMMNNTANQTATKKIRNFSGSPSEPLPIVLWVHQGCDRASFVEEQLRKRVMQMAQSGLLQEVFKHAVVFAIAHRRQQQHHKILNNNDNKNNGTNNAPVSASSFSSSSFAELRNLVAAASELTLESSTRGIESAIGFKEIVAPVLRFALKRIENALVHRKCSRHEDAGGDDTEQQQQQHVEDFVIDSVIARAEQLSTSDSDLSRVADWLFSDQASGAAAQAAATTPPSSNNRILLDKTLQDGLERVVSATRRYAAQQDQWLRRRFLPLRQDGTLPFFVAVVPQSCAQKTVSKKQYLCSEALLAMSNACRVSTETDFLRRQQERAMPMAPSLRYDVLRMLSDRSDASDPAHDEKQKDDDADETDARSAKRNVLFRCQHCDKAMLGEEQWQAHCATKAHQRNMHRVEVTADQIAQWKADGEAKREQRRRERGE